ncbi:MAG: AraC family transcriptional regulator [Hyphomonadaceae bacterium]|nr:AraC family transcriptional regulator [Hyphomonadaceae bacterium]
MGQDLFTLEMVARGVAIGALASMGASFARETAHTQVRLAGALFCIGTIAYALNSSPAIHSAIGWLNYPVHFLSLGGAGLFWLFIVTLFEDRPVAAATLWPWALLTTVGLTGLLAPAHIDPSIWVIHNLIEAAFSVHALYVVARSWRGDLVESRRRLRGPFLSLVTLYVLTLSAFEIAESLGYFQDWFRPLGAFSLALYCLAGAAVFLQARTALFGAVQTKPSPAEPGLNASDRLVLDKLTALMDAGAWRREGLTIGDLAAELGVPEHRLRPLINDHLGFRNFAAFVNARRIVAAKAMLADPAQSRTTVAAIAFDLGFGSLGPFNRAFKEATGVTPTEFRRTQSSPIPENPG